MTHHRSKRSSAKRSSAKGRVLNSSPSFFEDNQKKNKPGLSTREKAAIGFTIAGGTGLVIAIAPLTWALGAVLLAASPIGFTVAVAVYLTAMIFCFSMAMGLGSSSPVDAEEVAVPAQFGCQ